MPYASWKLAIPSLILAMASVAASTQARAIETRRVDGIVFTKIVVMHNVEVEVTQGSFITVRVQGSERDLAGDAFDLIDDELVLGRGRAFERKVYDALRFKVTMPRLRELRVEDEARAFVLPFAGSNTAAERQIDFVVEGRGSIRIFDLQHLDVDLIVEGSGDIHAAQLNVGDLEAAVAGSGDVYIKSLEAESAEAVVIGSGDLRISDASTVETLQISVIGAGDADFSAVACNTAEVTMLGSGNARLGVVRQTLSASGLGSGDLSYAGRPAVNQVGLGAGKVTRRP